MNPDVSHECQIPMMQYIHNRFYLMRNCTKILKIQQLYVISERCISRFIQILNISIKILTLLNAQFFKTNNNYEKV